LDGTVCAPGELPALVEAEIDLSATIKVIPNIRFPDSEVTNDDQNPERQGTPATVAAYCGHNGWPVMGRPIIDAPDPAAALERAETDFQKGLAIRTKHNLNPLDCA